MPLWWLGSRPLTWRHAARLAALSTQLDIADRDSFRWFILQTACAKKKLDQLHVSLGISKVKRGEAIVIIHLLITARVDEKPGPLHIFFKNSNVQRCVAVTHRIHITGRVKKKPDQVRVFVVNSKVQSRVAAAVQPRIHITARVEMTLQEYACLVHHSNVKRAQRRRDHTSLAVQPAHAQVSPFWGRGGGFISGDTPPKVISPLPLSLA